MFLFAGIMTLARNDPRATEAADPHQPGLDRLHSLGTLALADWRFRDEFRIRRIPHWTTRSGKASGMSCVQRSRVLRRGIEIPEKLDGYSVLGAKVQLDLSFASNAALVIALFSNGSVLYRGGPGHAETYFAHPGDKYLIAVPLDGQPVPTRTATSRLLIVPPANRPSPRWMRGQILAAWPLIAACAGGTAQREQQLDAVVRTIDLHRSLAETRHLTPLDCVSAQDS